MSVLTIYMSFDDSYIWALINIHSIPSWLKHINISTGCDMLVSDLSVFSENLVTRCLLQVVTKTCT